MRPAKHGEIAPSHSLAEVQYRFAPERSRDQFTLKMIDEVMVCTTGLKSMLSKVTVPVSGSALLQVALRKTVSDSQKGPLRRDTEEIEAGFNTATTGESHASQ